MNRPLITIAIILGTLSAKASALSNCGPITISGVFYQHAAYMVSGQQVHRYAAAVSLSNSSSLKSFGFSLKNPAVASNAGATLLESGPKIIAKTETELFVAIATSSQPLAGMPAIAPSFDFVDVTNSAFAQNIVFSYCPEYSTSDILFTSSEAPRSYVIQKSVDLVNWQAVETIAAPGEFTYWRGMQTNLASSPTLAREFFRLTAKCVAGSDCDSEQIRLQRSIEDLRKDYKSTP